MIMWPPNHPWTTTSGMCLCEERNKFYSFETPVIFGFAMNIIKYDHNKCRWYS